MRPSMKDWLLPRGVVFGILRQVAMRARFGDRADDRRAFLGLQLAQFLFEPRQTFRGHGELLHVVPFLRA